MADAFIRGKIKMLVPFNSAAFHLPNGVRYSVSDVGSVTEFFELNGRIAFSVEVSGQVNDPNGTDTWDPFGPEVWTFYVAEARAHSIELVVEADPEFGEHFGSKEPALDLVDISGPDAEMIEKYVNSGRVSQALPLINRVLGFN